MDPPPSQSLQNRSSSMVGDPSWVQVEGGILVRDIKESSNETQKLFAQLVVQACLPMKDESRTIHLITARHITEHCQTLFSGGLETRDEEGERSKLHLFALVRCLFELAGGREDTSQYDRCIQRDYTPAKGLIFLGSFIGASEVSHLRDPGMTKTLQFLSGCKAFEGERLTEEVLEQRAQLIARLPINMPLVDLPAACLVDLSRIQCTEFRLYRIETRLKVPILHDLVASTGLFLCWRSGFDPSVELIGYVRSPEGPSIVQPYLKCLREASDLGMLAISLLVMHWFFRLHGSVNNAGEICSGVDCLKRFHSLLHDDEISNAQWVVAKHLHAFSSQSHGVSEFLQSSGMWNQLDGDDVEPVLEDFWRYRIRGDSARVAFHKAIIASHDVS
ncbi:hypothetical protein PG990_013096 [Apiospora arundinis]